MRFLPFPPLPVCVSHTWCTEQVLAGARCWEVECHIERTQGQEVRRQSELLKGHRRGMTELPTQTSAEKHHLNRTGCYSFPVPCPPGPTGRRLGGFLRGSTWGLQPHSERKYFFAREDGHVIDPPQVSPATGTGTRSHSPLWSR